MAAEESKETKGLFGMTWRNYISCRYKERGQKLANSMTSCIRANGVIEPPQQRTLQEQIRNMHDPTRKELYEGLITGERGLKRSRKSTGGASTSHNHPSSSSEETQLEEDLHGVGTSQRGGRGGRRGGGHSGGGRRDGTRTRGGGGTTNKRGRGRNA
ncbi:uncharacterized protein LOC113312256 [Papaver somniferum]|uniref:uncharacterized protein LOC113312256 n=1 Tax=Papaver somniferum TaxID=3469 RepID=UPI000E6FCD03|nr:uncharacterized protein LOC113312256 [Papaver somniferum]